MSEHRYRSGFLLALSSLIAAVGLSSTAYAAAVATHIIGVSDGARSLYNSTVQVEGSTFHRESFNRDFAYGRGTYSVALESKTNAPLKQLGVGGTLSAYGAHSYIGGASLAILRDTIRFEIDGYAPGTAMTIEFGNGRIDGSMSVNKRAENNDTHANLSYWAELNSARVAEFYTSVVASGPAPADRTIDESISFTTIAASAGRDIPLSLSLSLFMSAQNWVNDASQALATADFMNTVHWGGIRDVKIGGKSVSYRLISSSGIDWSTPSPQGPNDVPEPAAFALLGLAVLATAARRQRI